MAQQEHLKVKSQRPAGEEKNLSDMGVSGLAEEVPEIEQLLGDIDQLLKPKREVHGCGCGG